MIPSLKAGLQHQPILQLAVLLQAVAVVEAACRASCEISTLRMLGEHGRIHLHQGLCQIDVPVLGVANWLRRLRRRKHRRRRRLRRRRLRRRRLHHQAQM